MEKYFLAIVVRIHTRHYSGRMPEAVVDCPFERHFLVNDEVIRISLRSIQWITVQSMKKQTDIIHETCWIDEYLNEIKTILEEKYLPYLVFPVSNHGNLKDNNRACSRRIATLLDMIKPIVNFRSRMTHQKFSPQFFAFEDVHEDVSLIHRNIIHVHTELIWSSPVGHYFLPRNSIFILDDIRRGLLTCANCSFLQHRYRTIVIDPPWSNKSAKRGKVYQTSFDNQELIALGSSLNKLYHPEGCLVAIWVTNNKSILDFVYNELLQEWGLSYVDTWWWVKLGIDEDGQIRPVCSIDSPHRKPYERVILASNFIPPHISSIPRILSKKRRIQTLDHADESQIISQSEVIIDDDTSPVSQHVIYSQITPKIIFSLPIRHSWKPALQHFLRDTLGRLLETDIATLAVPSSLELPSETQSHIDLELFARELREGCTSIGNEVLFHQTVNIIHL